MEKSVDLSSGSTNFSAFFDQYLAQDTWVVAYSGGLDSSVLLHAAKSALDVFRSESQANVSAHSESPKPVPKLVACHVNHQLSPNSNHWARHCVAFCEALGVPLQTHVIAVQDQGQGLESAARDARYAVFEQAMPLQGGVLFTAHHSDDQAETLLLKLARGEGLKGLRGIHSSRLFAQGVIARPLLSQSRQSLANYAQRCSLQWVEDESNQNRDFDRNFLRHEVMPILSERWPAYVRRSTLAAQHAEEQCALLDEVASEDLTPCRVPESLFGECLDLEPLLAMSLARRKNCLMNWFESFDIFALNAEQWRQLEQGIQQSLTKHRPYQLILQRSQGSKKSTKQFNVYDGKLYAVADHWQHCDDPAWSKKLKTEWKKTQAQLVGPQAELPNRIDILLSPVGEMYLTKSPQSPHNHAEKGQAAFTIDTSTALSADILANADVQLCPASTITSLPVRGVSQRLKNLFQQHRVPHWLRHHYPVLTMNEQGLAIPGIVLADHESVPRAGDVMYSFEWRYF